MPKKHIVRPHKDFTVDLGEGVTLEMVWIPGGTFMMGEEGLQWEEPVHQVKLDGFWMGKFPVTQAQAVRYYEDEPIELDCYFEGADLPIDSRGSYGAACYCEFLSELTGQMFCLPTEAQWEYACRGGTQSRYFFGDDPILLDDYAWHRENSGGTTHPVGQKKPNPFGLYDMVGNVWQWCRDKYNDSFYKTSPKSNPVCEKGMAQTMRNVLRGGSWCSLPHACRSAHRYCHDWKMNHTGFRIAALDEKYTTED